MAEYQNTPALCQGDLGRYSRLLPPSSFLLSATLLSFSLLLSFLLSLSLPSSKLFAFVNATNKTVVSANIFSIFSPSLLSYIFSVVVTNLCKLVEIHCTPENRFAKYKNIYCFI